MTIYEIILKRRSIRKFKQLPIATETLTRLVNAARLAPQGTNFQPLKYVIVNDESLLEPIFQEMRWAGHIRPAGDPQEGERPVAYIVVLVDTDIKKVAYDTDAGAAIQNILLAALGEGIGTCWLGNFIRDKISVILSVPEKYIIHSIVALGYPAEEPVIVDEQGSIKYYKDEQGVLHVPKRKLEDVALFNTMPK